MYRDTYRQSGTQIHNRKLLPVHSISASTVGEHCIVNNNCIMNTTDIDKYNIRRFDVDWPL